jgi:hypothetical protein
VQPVDIQKYNEAPVGASNPLAVTQSPAISSQAVSVGDGQNVVEGALADAAIVTDASGSISGKLRGIIKLLVDKISVKIDQTTPGTTNAVACKIIDEAGTPYGVQHVSNKPRVSAMPYLYDIAEGNVSGHTLWEKIGYSVMVGTTTKDIWSYTDNIITIPTTGTAMEVYTNSANDLGTSIHSGNTTTGGSTTTLEKTGENFLTTTAVGDLVIVDAAGATPEYGFITAIDSDEKITFSGGLSSGGSGASRSTYNIIDVSATTGAHAVLMKYLTSDFAEKSEIIVCGGNAVGVNLVNTDVVYINSLRVISAGSGGVAAAAIKVQDADGTPPIYTYITAGYTRARNSLYTVPADKTLYIAQINVGYATTSNQIQNARIILRAKQNDRFKTNLFQAMAEVIGGNNTVPVEMLMPLKIVAGVSLKFTGVPSANGIITTAARGWLE